MFSPPMKLNVTCLVLLTPRVVSRLCLAGVYLEPSQQVGDRRMRRALVPSLPRAI